MPTNKESLALDVNCEREGYTVEAVPCKVFLPVKRGGRVLLKLYPTDEQREILQYWWEFKIKGAISYENGLRKEVRASAVYWKYEEHEYVTWGAGRTDHILACEPADLRIIYKFKRHSEGTGAGDSKTKVAIWITPSTLLSHPRITKPLEGGGFEVDTIYLPNFSLPSGGSLTFRQAFRAYANELGESVYFSEPVLEYEAEGADADLEGIELLQTVEAFLELISFASRYRSVWLGWEAGNNEEDVTYFRNNITQPPLKGRSYDDELIWLNDIEEFIGAALKHLKTINQTEGILRAINYTIPRAGEFLDSSFIMLYAALETLVLDYRRRKGLEFVFESRDDFAAFQKRLKKWIKEDPAAGESPEKRKLLYDKLPELNRVSFRAAFEQFCTDYRVDVSDLWPILGKPQEMPLTEIRNKIVHGDKIDYERRGVMYCARENLKWCVERMILAVLGWPVDRTRCSPSYLKSARMTMYDWKQYQQNLVT